MTRSRLAQILASTTLVLSACSGGTQPESTLSATYGSGDGGGGGEAELDLGSGDEGEGGGICLLNNCESDEHCGSSADGRTTCDVESGRCVECEETAACSPGEVCTQWGFCVPESQECELGPDGEPLVVCATNSDCLACDPSRHVCDTTANRCVECAPNQAGACQTTEQCSAGSCVDKCPASCDTPADCDACTTAMGGAHACVAHHCAECDESHPCGGDEVCTQGSCVDPCGIVEEDIIGLCDVDDDCSGCPGEATSCNPTINGGHGEQMP